MHVFCRNLKRFRIAKNMTQEQAAEALGVSTQTVSRWECSTTLPDVTVLPKLAALYCVTIDDLYKESSIAYDNHAQRLGSVYEATGKPDDFLRADLEYRKLIKSGEYTTEDLRLYGILHQYMMQYCMERAEDLFDRVIRMGPEADLETYWSTRRQKGCFLYEIGRNEENVREFLPLVEAGSDDIHEWVCLIQAYQLEGNYASAWNWAEKAEKKFPESAMLHIYCGSLCKAMKRYEDAFAHWKRARELEPDWLDPAYSMGFCYEELGDDRSAYEIWMEIAENLSSRGFEAEINWPKSLAVRCKERLSQLADA